MNEPVRSYVDEFYAGILMANVRVQWKYVIRTKSNVSRLFYNVDPSIVIAIGVVTLRPYSQWLDFSLDCFQSVAGYDIWKVLCRLVWN